jgi:hypothetical protein
LRFYFRNIDIFTDTWVSFHNFDVTDETLTEERQRAEGRKYNFCSAPKGFRANKFMKKEKIYIPSSRRKKYYVPIESLKFIYRVSLLPPASCLLNLIQVTFKRSIKLKTSSL